MREEIKNLRLKNFELEKGLTELKVTKEVMEKQLLCKEEINDQNQ